MQPVGLRHADPDLARDQHAGHLGRADADHECPHGAAGRGVRIAAHGEHAWQQVAVLLHDHVTDALHVVETLDGLVPCPAARERKDFGAFNVHGRHEVIADDDDLVRIPDARPEAFQVWGDAPGAAGVVHHREVHATGDDLARADRGQAS